MKHRKVLHAGQMPAKLPITWTAVVWLLMDRLKPPAFVWGVVGTWVVIIWLIAIIAVWTQDDTKIEALK